MFFFYYFTGAYRNQEDERKQIRNAEDRQKQGLLSRLAEEKRQQKEQSVNLLNKDYHHDTFSDEHD